MPQAASPHAQENASQVAPLKWLLRTTCAAAVTMRRVCARARVVWDGIIEQQPYNTCEGPRTVARSTAVEVCAAWRRWLMA